EGSGSPDAQLSLLDRRDIGVWEGASFSGVAGETDHAVAPHGHIVQGDLGSIPEGQPSVADRLSPRLLLPRPADGTPRHAGGELREQERRDERAPRQRPDEM